MKRRTQRRLRCHGGVSMGPRPRSIDSHRSGLLSALGPAPPMDCLCVQCQLPVRTQGPQRSKLSHAGRGNAGTFPRVCRKGAGGAAGWRKEAAFQANWRQSGKLPETPEQAAGRAWVIVEAYMTSGRPRGHWLPKGEQVDHMHLYTSGSLLATEVAV